MRRRRATPFGVRRVCRPGPELLLSNPAAVIQAAARTIRAPTPSVVSCALESTAAAGRVPGSRSCSRIFQEPSHALNDYRRVVVLLTGRWPGFYRKGVANIVGESRLAIRRTPGGRRLRQHLRHFQVEYGVELVGSLSAGAISVVQNYDSPAVICLVYADEAAAREQAAAHPVQDPEHRHA